MVFILSLDLQSPVCFATCYVYGHTPHIVIWRLGNDRAWGYTMKGVDGYLRVRFITMYHIFGSYFPFVSRRDSKLLRQHEVYLPFCNPGHVHFLKWYKGRSNDSCSSSYLYCPAKSGWGRWRTCNHIRAQNMRHRWNRGVSQSHIYDQQYHEHHRSLELQHWYPWNPSSAFPSHGFYSTIPIAKSPNKVVYQYHLLAQSLHGFRLPEPNIGLVVGGS